MKFLHTADFQIGMKADHVGASAEKVREQRLEAVRRLIDAAKENGAEFVLIAGDLFEDNGVDRTLILRTADILAGFGRPVFIIPGNHDPFVPGSVWSHFAWGQTPNLRVLGDEKEIEIPGGVLYPCPIRDKYSTKDPTAWIPIGAADNIRIGIAHGNVEGLPQADLDHPIARNAAERAKMDYLALGHWHSTATYPDSSGFVHMAYCGTPETSRFGERDSGNALLVEIDGPGAFPKIRQIRTGKLRWETEIREIKSGGDLGAILAEFEAIQDSQNLLLALELTGVLHTADIQDLKNLEDILLTRFLYARLDNSKLQPSPEDNSWIDNLPAGFVREAAGRLYQVASSEREDAKIAARALLELYVIAKEVTQ